MTIIAEFPPVHHTNMTDPEQALRLEWLAVARIMERVYQGDPVDLGSITRPGVRGRVEAALMPHQLGYGILERVMQRQAVNLDVIRKQHPAAYAGYSHGIEQLLRRTAWQAERTERERQKI